MRVDFMGGLGNQMFQYAFGRSLSLARNIPLFFDKGWCDGRPDYLSYSLSAYALDIRFGGPDGPRYVEQGLPFDKGVFSAPAASMFHGYWQTEKYFNAEVIRKELSCPSGEPSDRTKRLAQNIDAAQSSAFVHVRRGDYLQTTNQQIHGCPSLEYYREGMRRIEERGATRFFIFSDDAEWCRQTFLGRNVEVVDGSDREKCWDVWLMSLCSHAVISNSSFSWWGAWLGRTNDRIVVAPKTWFVTKTLDSRDIIPDRWVQL